jgi:hypothetical protein
MTLNYLRLGGYERQTYGGGSSYFFKAGRIHTGLTVVEYLLADEGPGDGGLCVIPGSHKSELPMPATLSRREKHARAVHEVKLAVGETVIKCPSVLY